MSQRTYSVPEISCAHCKASIEGGVGAVAGVDLVEVDVASRTVRVVGDAADSSVRAAIEEAGYDIAGVSQA